MNKRKKTILTSILFWLLLSGFNEYGKPNQDAIDLSLINLIATPEKYHNKPVRVIGVANLEFESHKLYINKEDRTYSVFKSAVCLAGIDLEAIGKSEKEILALNGKHVLVEGVFNKDRNGHFGMSSGCIINITRFMPWETEKSKKLSK